MLVCSTVLHVLITKIQHQFSAFNNVMKTLDPVPIRYGDGMELITGDDL